MSPIPTVSPAFAAAIGIVNTTATVDVDGTITTTGDLTLRSTSRNTTNVVARPDVLAGFAVGVAVTHINSDSEVNVGQTAHLTAGNNLFVKAETFDSNRTLANSIAGLDGQVALSIAVSVEAGDTQAHLDGFADAAGMIQVDASQQNLPIDNSVTIGYLPASVFGAPISAPEVLSGVKAYAATGQTSTGNLTDDFVRTAKDVQKYMIGFNAFKQRTVQAFKDKTGLGGPPTENSLDLSGAFAVVVDSNEVDARIGDGDATNGRTDVEADGAITVSALIEARPDVSAVSISRNSALTRDYAVLLGVTILYGALTIVVNLLTDLAYAWFDPKIRY